MNDLIYKLLAFKDIDKFDLNIAIDWAQYTIKHETLKNETIIKISLLKKPVKKEEIIPLLTKVFSDLRIDSYDYEKRMLSYCYFLIKKIGKGVKIRGYLSELYAFSIDRKFDKTIVDLMRLHLAWEELEMCGHTNYWDGANLQNIDAIAIIMANDWINKHFKNIEIV